MPTATIKLFLVHGEPKRLRTAELSNWTGKAIAGPRSELDGVLAREEAAKPGVYFLSGIDSESGKPAVYVGEAESIRDRLRGHLDKDFWNHVVFFVSKDENLTKAHIRYLEGRLIEQARSVGRAMVMNGQSSGANLPESDREDMEIFLDRIHQLMPVLGADALLPIGQAPEGQDGDHLKFTRDARSSAAPARPPPSYTEAQPTGSSPGKIRMARRLRNSRSSNPTNVNRYPQSFLSDRAMRYR